MNFRTGKKFKTAKNAISRKKRFLIYLISPQISRVFLPGLFKIFWPTVYYLKINYILLFLIFAELDPILKSRRSSDSWIESEESIEKLKKDTRLCFNDIFFRKLDNIETTFEEDKQRSVFFSTLNRRLKRIATLYA